MRTKILIILMAGVLMIGSNLYAGDLVVNGKLGVGNSTPTANLDIQGTNAQWSYLVRNSAGNAVLGFWPTNAGNGAFIILDSTGNQAVRFETANGNSWINTGGNVGIGTPNPQQRLHVAGYVFASDFIASSDIRWKKNIVSLENSLENVLKLQGVNYEWRVEEYKDRNFKEGKQIGLVAQEVEKVIPELVNTDTEGYKAVSYEKLTAVLVEAIKEQQKKIAELESRIKMLEK